MSAALEAAVARLEKIADRFDHHLQVQGSVPTAINGASTAPTSKTTTPSPSGGSSPLEAYQELLTKHISPVIDAAESIGGEILTATRTFVEGYQLEKNIVEAMGVCQKPDVPQLQTLLQPVGDKMMAIGELGGGPRSPYVQHYKMLSEAVQALSWVAYTGPGCGLELPSKHVENAWSAAEFYGNKILVEWKTKDPNHVSWVHAIKELTQALKAYCSRYFPAGPAWNNTAGGIPVAQFKPGTTSSSSSSTSTSTKAPTKKAGPPPPPPPPPGGLQNFIAAKDAANKKPASSAAAAGNPMAALFAEINKGEGITKGLKKVTDDMKTKNRADRTGAVLAAESDNPTTTKNTAAAAVKPAGIKQGTPRIECEQGRKWVVEHQVGNREIIISETEAKQSVYIFNCANSTIQVTGKVNAITLDGCSRCGVVFDSVVSSCEIVNCKSVEVQCTATVPTLAVDKSDGCQLYLTKESLELTDITTAKASAVNLIIPGATEEDDPVECAIPEQFVTKYVNGKFVTEAVSHSGG